MGREPLPLNDPHSSLRMVNTGIFVTDLGYRCANESMTSQFDYFTPFVKSGRKEFTIICDSQQPEARAALIAEAVELGVASKAETLEELAEAAGLPVYPLMKTVERYNELCDGGEDLSLIHISWPQTRKPSRTPPNRTSCSRPSPRMPTST